VALRSEIIGKCAVVDKNMRLFVRSDVVIFGMAVDAFVKCDKTVFNVDPAGEMEIVDNNKRV
jgi:hypothetical protein